MPELLLELLSEDIPARMQARAAEDLKRLVTEKLKAAGFDFQTAEAYVTPRRLVLVVDGLPTAQPDVIEERKGPRVGSPEPTVRGFLRSVGMTLDQLDRRDTDKGTFYFAVLNKPGEKTVNVLEKIIKEVVRKFPWPKTMRWRGGIRRKTPIVSWEESFKWVRPLRNVLAIFDGEPVSGMLGGTLLTPQLEFGSMTQGHRFLSPAPIGVTNFYEFKSRLHEAYVLVDTAERRQRIWEDACLAAKAERLSVKPDDGLLAEVAGMVEWPKVFIGDIDEAFMDLPAEVLTTVMRHNQKYFSLLKSDGSLAPAFIVVADTEPDDGGKAIVAGNERVLKARLADARFFWDKDRMKTLESRVPALEGIIFHAKIGTLAEKVARLQTLAAELAPSIPNADVDHVRRAALLSKADLTTEMVGEFPELQGLMGRYYALHDGERPEVAEAVAEHYAPLGPGDRCPTAPTSVAVALADKIDSLVGFFAIGERPTGSKDPYALRRAALGVIRLILENGLRVPLINVFAAAVQLHQAIKVTAPSDSEIVYIANSLGDFFADRLKVHLREKGIRHDLINAVFAEKLVDRETLGDVDLVRILKRVDALENFLESDNGANLLVAYRRAANIVRIEEKRDDDKFEPASYDPALADGNEKTLWDALEDVGRAVEPLLQQEQFTEAMAELARLRKPVDVFFDTVTVNVEAQKLRANRLCLLADITETMNTVADFSQIEG